jgi:hypothetical protein
MGSWGDSCFIDHCVATNHNGPRSERKWAKACLLQEVSLVDWNYCNSLQASRVEQLTTLQHKGSTKSAIAGTCCLGNWVSSTVVVPTIQHGLQCFVCGTTLRNLVSCPGGFYNLFDLDWIDMTCGPFNLMTHQRLSLELALNREVKMTWLANTAEDLSSED